MSGGLTRVYETAFLIENTHCKDGCFILDWSHESYPTNTKKSSKLTEPRRPINDEVLTSELEVG